MAAMKVKARHIQSDVKDATPRPARAAEVKVTDDNGSAASQLVNFLAEKKLI